MMMMNAWGILEKEKEVKIVHVQVERPCLLSHDHLIVKVHACAINPVDLHKIRARKEGLFIPGFEASGVVVECGDHAAKNGFAIGDRVFLLMDGNSKSGSFAEFCQTKWQSAAKIPDSLEFAQAACVPLAGLTAWESLFECLNLQENERGKSLLVIGGAGGVGSFAIQFAKQKTRLKIIASASSEESRDWCLSLGADHVIDHSKGNFKEGLKNLNLNGVDYILNCFDASIAKQISEVIEPFGKVCMISAGSAINNVDLGFFFFKRVTISFEVVFGRSRFGVDCEKQHLILIEIAKLFEQSKLKIPLRKTLQIFEANEALELISTGHTIGKIALIR